MKKLGRTFSVCTHLGKPYLTTDMVNVYFDEEALLKDYKMAIELIQGRYIKPEWRGGRLFISSLNSSKCNFILAVKPSPSNFDKTVSLRTPYRLKEVQS
jgi:hypothetical protein